MAGKRSESPSQLRKGVLDLAVLTILARTPTYGGDLLESLAERPGLHITSGTLYPLLTRLRASGLIEATWQESPVGPPRKFYALTTKGRRTHADLIAQWRELSAAMNHLLEEHR